MSVNWTPLADLIETHDRFLVTTHVRPDGDALGSEVGMVGLLHRRARTCGWSTPAPLRQGTISSTRSELSSSILAPRCNRPTWPTVSWRSSSISRPGTSLATWPSTSAVSRAQGRDRPSPQSGRPGCDIPQGYVGRGDRHPGHACHQGARRHADARRGDRFAHGDRHGHGLVSPYEHPARNPSRRG